jgi:membrane protein
VLSELKKTLNRIWRTDEPSGVKALLGRNLRFLGVIAAVGFLLLVSLVVSAALSALGKYMSGVLPAPETVMQAINFLVSWGVISALFGVMFKVLPNTEIPWRDVRMGAAATGLLFSVGKLALGYYLGRKTVGSFYGAAGSVLILLLWIYYSGLIFYFGAEFTRVYSERHGSRTGRGGDPEIKKAA